MSDLQEIILIGEPDNDRFHWLENLLYEKFGKQAKQVKTLEEISSFFDNLTKFKISLVFISDDLPLSSKMSKKDPFINFNTLQFNPAFSLVDFVCVVTNEGEPNLEELKKRPYHVHLRNFPPTDEDRQRIVIELGALGNRLSPLIEISEIEKIVVPYQDSRTLRRQIRSLSETQDIEDGEKHLFRLIGNCLDCKYIEQIEIKQLGQGKSGASVFRLKVRYKNNSKKEYVIKLSNLLWKLESEVKGHLKATKTHEDGYTKHVAKIRRPLFSINLEDSEMGHHFIVNSGQWYAIHYDFLGGEDFGKFIDLETELIVTPAILKEKTRDASSLFFLDSEDWEKVTKHRLNVLNAILDGLCDLWYANKEFTDRKIKAIWDIEDAPAKDSIPFPPYQLTQRVKGWVQDFLDSREASFGNRLFSDWENHIASVLKLVGDESISDLGLLNKKLPLTLSPVHGDLNANNVLLWLKYDKYPFLIDLPFYEEYSHPFQDFARLETEIKFALMDRQEESPADQLIAFDNTVSQVPLWVEMEKNLLDETSLNEPTITQFYSEECKWNENGYQNNVTLCYKLILLIRKKAFEVQQKNIIDKPAPSPFADEYLPALLYHTIRSIGYPSLSVFKRLLAVYSAGSIINKLIKR